MKAITLTDVKKFELIDKPQPVSTDGKAIIKTSKCGICGSDIHMIWNVGYKAGTDFVIGHEFCGTIVDPGASDSLKVGDRVVAMEIDPCGKCDFCHNGQPNLCAHVLDGGPGIGNDGGYAEYVAVRHDMVRKIPDSMSDVAGALVEPASISMHAVKLAGVKEGSTVLVTGAGTIGLFAAACAHALGAGKVVITEVNQERIKVADEADFVSVALNRLDKDLKDKLFEIAPEGFDAVIECTGNQIASTQALSALKRGGHMILVAFGKQPNMDLLAFVNMEQHISGSVFFTDKEFELVIDLIAEGKLDLEKYTELIKPEDVQTTLENIENGTANAIKYVIDFD